MDVFKVYGEERSGTTYLEKLLKQNSDMRMLSNMTRPLERWKHGFPKYWGDDTLHILLIRDLFEWVRSVINMNGGRFNGLEEGFGNVPGQKQHDHWKQWKHPLEARYAKIKSYLAFKEQYPCVILKTEYLKQKPDVICDFVTCPNGFKDISTHVRLGIKAKDDPERPELTEKQKMWLFDNHNPELESFVDGLTYINAL